MKSIRDMIKTVYSLPTCKLYSLNKGNFFVFNKTVFIVQNRFSNDYQCLALSGPTRGNSNIFHLSLEIIKVDCELAGECVSSFN